MEENTFESVAYKVPTISFRTQDNQSWTESEAWRGDWNEYQSNDSI